MSDDVFRKYRWIGLLFCVASLALVGCDKPLSNAESIALSKVCTQAGLVPYQFYNLSGHVTDIQCQQLVYH